MTSVREGRGRALTALAACLRGKPPADIDWTSVIALANESLTTATLAVKIGGDESIPLEVGRFLAVIGKRNRDRNRKLKTQLAEACKALNKIGVTPILLKGTATLVSSRQGHEARMISDLDLLVLPADLTRSVQRLREIGYGTETCASDIGRSEPVTLSRPQDAGTVDLHSRPRGPSAFNGLDILYTHCTSVRVGKGTALLPSPTFQILYLVLHDQFHDRDYWRGLIDLRHMLDIAELSAPADGVQWDMLKSLLPSRYARNALATHLLTARELLGAEVPPDLTRGLLPRLQYIRRLLQAEHPYLMTPLLLVTILTELPHRNRDGRDRRQDWLKQVRGKIRGLQRLLSFKAPGKI